MSKLRQLNLLDVLNGIFFAVGWALLTGILEILQQLKLGQPFSLPTLQYLLISAGIWAVWYLLKRFFSNSEWTLFTNDPTKT